MKRFKFLIGVLLMALMLPLSGCENLVDRLLSPGKKGYPNQVEELAGQFRIEPATVQAIIDAYNAEYHPERLGGLHGAASYRPPVAGQQQYTKEPIDQMITRLSREYGIPRQLMQKLFNELD